MKYLLSFVIIFVVPTLLLGNGATFHHGVHGGSLLPIENRKIKMRSENVIIDASNVTLINEGDEIPIQCTFNFQNISKDTVKILMGFPFVTKASDEIGFTVFVDDQQVDAKKNEEYGAYDCVFTWKVRFKPGQSKQIICKYNGDADVSRADGSGDDWSFIYIAHTGGYWAGPIDTAHFIFKLPKNADSYLKTTIIKDNWVSYSRLHATIQPVGSVTNGNSIEWVKYRWMPDTIRNDELNRNIHISKDDFVVTFSNSGLSDLNDFFDVKYYDGNSRAYDGNDLMIPDTRANFQESEGEENNNTLEYYKLLRNEIFARRGYEFKNDTLASFFSALSWYRPVSTNVQAQLSKIEKTNIEFINQAVSKYIEDKKNENKERLRELLTVTFKTEFEQHQYSGGSAIYDEGIIGPDFYGNDEMYQHMKVKLLRNEIYARHGLIFKSQDLNMFFNQMKWYKPASNTMVNLNEIESKNVRFLMSFEKRYK
jgi:hypothetical protein